MPQLHCSVCFHFLISDRLCVKIKKKKKKRNAAERRSSAPRLRRTQRRVGSLLPQRAAALIHGAIAPPATLAFHVGSETKYGEERSAVRASTKNDAARIRSCTDRKCRSARSKWWFIFPRQPNASPARGAPTIVCCARRNYLEREQAAKCAKIPENTSQREGERERLQRTLLCCGHRSWETSAAASSHLVSFLPLNVGEVSRFTWAARGRAHLRRVWRRAFDFCPVLHPISPNISAEFPLSCDSFFPTPQNWGRGVP